MELNLTAIGVFMVAIFWAVAKFEQVQAKRDERKLFQSLERIKLNNQH